MEDKMSFVLKPSLQHMAMAKIVIEMWIQDDVMALMPAADIFYPELALEEEEKPVIIIKMREKLRVHLHLPDVMKTQLLAFIKPVGKQLFLWNRYLRDKFHVEGIHPENIRWTSYGTIHQQKSVQALVRNRHLDLAKRFRLACAFCLTEDIDALMKDLPEMRVVDSADLAEVRRQVSGALWMCYLTSDKAELNAMYAECLLPHALHAFRTKEFSYNATVTKYLFENKLNPAEIISYTQRAFKRFNIYDEFYSDFSYDEFFPELLCFLLSRMNPDQREEIFHKHWTEVLQNMLIWPYQGLFVETAKRMWRFFSRDHYENLLTIVFYSINDKINYDNRVCEYRDILGQFWKLSPIAFRKFVIGHHDFFNCLYAILKKGEDGVCRMILADADAAEKEKLVRNVDYSAIRFYRQLIEGEKWNSIEFFLRECAPNADTIREFKKLLIDCECLKLIKEKQMKEFFHFLDNFILLEQKKMTGETTNNKAAA